MKRQSRDRRPGNRKRRPPLTRLQKFGITPGPKRPQLTRRQTLLICGAVLAIVAPIIAVGAISESRQEADTAAKSATQTSEHSTALDADPEPTPTADPSQNQHDEPTEYDETHLQFGHTAHFTTSAGGSDTPLEFTVSAPKPFTPGKNATFREAGSPVVVKGKRQPTNVYFTVTVKNTSKDESWDSDFLFSSVTETGDDDVVSEVYDDDIEGLVDLNGGRDLRPGKSATVKEGFSVQSADNIQYELDVDGLAGTSFYFTK